MSQKKLLISVFFDVEKELREKEYSKMLFKIQKLFMPLLFNSKQGKILPKTVISKYRRRNCSFPPSDNLQIIIIYEKNITNCLLYFENYLVTRIAKLQDGS